MPLPSTNICSVAFLPDQLRFHYGPNESDFIDLDIVGTQLAFENLNENARQSGEPGLVIGFIQDYIQANHGNVRLSASQAHDLIFHVRAAYLERKKKLPSMQTLPVITESTPSPSHPPNS